MAQRHIAVLLLTILLVPLAGAYCDTQAAEREVHALCNQTNASTVPAPGTGEALLNGTSVEEVDCSRLDRDGADPQRSYTVPGLPPPRATGSPGLPIAAGMMAVRRSGQRRRTLLMTLSAMALSITIGVLGTLQYTTIV